MEDFSCGFMQQHNPLQLKRNMGQDGRFRSEEKASILCVLDLLGVLFTKLYVTDVLMAPLFLHRHL